jgi:RNA polymerase sigma factor (sigma-70 family)
MLEPLVRRYGTSLLTFIRHMVRDQQRSEDVYQDVFLSVWNKRSQYRFPRPFKPWLYTIAINRVREVVRRHEVWAHTLQDQVPIDDVVRATEWYALFPALLQEELARRP